MSWTKRQFVDQAFEEIGMASYVFDLSDDQRLSVLRRLDAMMGTWNAKGIRIGYPIPSSPENSSLSSETNVPDAANEAIYLNLAMRIAPAFGKMIPNETKVSAKSGYDVLLMRAVFPPAMQMPGTMPAGAGNKERGARGPFLDSPSDTIDAGADSAINFE